MAETPRTMVVKDPSSTLPVALRRVFSASLRDLYSSPKQTIFCRLRRGDADGTFRLSLV
jgi:hypothetical protein